MYKVKYSDEEFDLKVQVVSKRPDEAAAKIVDLELENSRLIRVLECIYESGDYSRETESLIREGLGLDRINIRECGGE